MNPNILIRSETDDDVSAINEVTVTAFRTLEISNHTEQFIIKALRAVHALTLSLVAELDGLIVGHLAFSPVTISDGTKNWYGLGHCPVLRSIHCCWLKTGSGSKGKTAVYRVSPQTLRE